MFYRLDILTTHLADIILADSHHMLPACDLSKVISTVDASHFDAFRLGKGHFDLITLERCVHLHQSLVLDGGGGDRKGG